MRRREKRETKASSESESVSSVGAVDANARESDCDDRVVEAAPRRSTSSDDREKRCASAQKTPSLFFIQRERESVCVSARAKEREEYGLDLSPSAKPIN